MPTGTLPPSGKKIFERVYREALSGSCKGDKQCAAQSAWSAVKGAGWKKVGGKWTKKSAVVEMPMYITKATTDGKTMRWAATNSDTQKDSYEERMSYELYKSFIQKIKDNVPVPEAFREEICSEYWQGGMPYVSVSHYSDLNGDGVPGKPLQIYIDGNQDTYRLKAKGILYNTPLGHSVYRSLKQDKFKNPDEKIRISIGFLDLSHRHGDGNLFVRDSLFSVCPDCLEGVGDKVYVDGYLIHLALTRVPVNKRTDITVLEEKSMATKAKKKITRKEDAESIVGKELAEEMDAKQRVSKSDAIVEMSENETEEETKELVEEIEKKEPDVSVNDDEVQTEDEEATEEEVVLDSVTEKSVEKPIEKSDPTMDKVVDQPETYVANLPYGGATSMRDAENYVAAKNEVIYLMDMWSVFSNVVFNIFDRGDISDKRAVLNSAVDEFKNVLTAKAMVAFSVTEKSDPESESHPLQDAVDSLLESVDNSRQLKADTNERLASINPALQQLGTAITDLVSRSDSNDEPTESAPAPVTDIEQTLKNSLQPILDGLNSLSERLGVIESKSNAQNVEARPRIPAPRSLSPQLVAKSEPAVKPGSLRDIINKSVGLTS